MPCLRIGCALRKLEPLFAGSFADTCKRLPAANGVLLYDNGDAFKSGKTPRKASGNIPEPARIYTPHREVSNPLASARRGTGAHRVNRFSEREEILSLMFLVILGASTLWLAWRLNRYWHALDRALENPGIPLEDDFLTSEERGYLGCATGLRFN